MPAVSEKQTVLGGRGHVCRFASGTSKGAWVYREWNKATRSYRTKHIEGATTLEQAIEKAADAAIALRESIAQANQPIEKLDPLNLIAREEKLQRDRERLLKAERKGDLQSVPINVALDAFLRQQKRRVATGQLAKNSYEHKFHCLSKVRSYLEEYGITKTSQLTETTFDEYLIYRSDTTRILQAREVAVLGEWIKSYLVRNKYISPELWIKGSLLPKVEIRHVDRMANPAINPEDWKVIVDYVREVWKEQANEPRACFWKGELKTSLPPLTKTIWYRNFFWHYILLSKNTGMSPEEVLKLKWKNVRVEDVGRISRSKIEEDMQAVEEEGIGDMLGTVDEWYDAETGGDPNAWADSPNAVGRDERLIAYITTIRSKTKQPREIPCNQGKELRRWMRFMRKSLKEWNIDYTFTGDSHVFFNPFNDFKPMSQARVRQTWRKLVDKLNAEGKLKGHKFSDHKYTLYSMRSTFIEDHLMKGTDIFLLARIAGHDVKTLMQSYERMDIKKRAEEITYINYGQSGKETKSVDLLSEDI